MCIGKYKICFPVSGVSGWSSWLSKNQNYYMSSALYNIHAYRLTI